MRSVSVGLRWISELGLMALALGFGAGAAAAQIGRWVPRYDLATHFAFLWLAAGLLTAILACLHREGWRRLFVGALGGATVLSAGSLIAPELVRDRTTVGAGNSACLVKVIEFNARNAATDPEAVARWVVSEGPDIAVLIEAPPGLERRIKARTGLKTILWDGVLMASRWENVSFQAAWPPIGLPGSPLTFSWMGYEAFPPNPIPVIAVHPGWPIPSRRARSETARIVGILDRVDRRSAILVGDFNSTQFSFRHRQAEAAFGLERRDTLIPTWPDVVPFFGDRFRSPVPFLPIDHIYAGSNWRTVEVRRGPRLGSDHYPLIATLAWVGPLRTGDPATSCPH